MVSNATLIQSAPPMWSFRGMLRSSAADKHLPRTKFQYLVLPLILVLGLGAINFDSGRPFESAGAFCRFVRFQLKQALVLGLTASKACGQILIRPNGLTASKFKLFRPRPLNLRRITVWTPLQPPRAVHLRAFQV
jgi:hypothetical protein